MNRLSFESNITQRIYDDYMRRVEKNTSLLSAADCNELIMEINSHIHEGTIQSKDMNKDGVLLDILERLGPPEEFLKPLVARKKLNQAVTTFKPSHIFQALRLNLTNGFIYSIFGLLYLFLGSFLLLILAKIISPSHTGLFYTNGEFGGFGFVRETTGQVEVLGYWIIPISMAVAFILYVCITLILRLKTHK
ncbi:MAG: hypothetical protein HXX13_09000 [Bacteroidetes bacterium]|nr:hypothetical protein [Bacteroidota bacterium]